MAGSWDIPEFEWEKLRKRDNKQKDTETIRDSSWDKEKDRNWKRNRDEYRDKDRDRDSDSKRNRDICRYWNGHRVEIELEKISK